MLTTISYKGKDYTFTYDLSGVSGSCGTCTIYCMEIPDEIEALPFADRRRVAKKIGDSMLARARYADYGVALFTTIVQGSPLADPFSAYYGSPDDGHKDAFNLGTVARALGGIKGVSAANPNTGNIITSYTVST